MVTNATIEALLGRRSIRKFKDEAIDDDTRVTLETVAQHAASSQFLNDWSAIRITDPATKAKLAEFGHQPYRPFAVWCGWVCQVVTVLRSSLPQVR